MECPECGKTATVSRRNYRLEGMGIPVELRNIEVIRCEDCGESPVIPNMEGMMETLATAVVLSPQKLTGAEVRFLRKFVGKRAREFAAYIDVEPTTLSKIENGQRALNPRVDKLIRFTVLGLARHLQGQIRNLVELGRTVAKSQEVGGAEIQIDPETREYAYA